MSIDSNDVKKLARLSRLRVEEADLDSYTNDLSKVLGFVEQLNELDTSNVEPMTGSMDMTQRLREDTVTDGGYPERITQNAPDNTMNFFTVPKVVE